MFLTFIRIDSKLISYLLLATILCSENQLTSSVVVWIPKHSMFHDQIPKYYLTRKSYPSFLVPNRQQTYVQNRTRVAKVASYETSQETSVSCTQLVVLYAPFQFGSEYNFLVFLLVPPWMLELMHLHKPPKNLWKSAPVFGIIHCCWTHSKCRNNRPTHFCPITQKSQNGLSCYFKLRSGKKWNKKLLH